MVLIEITKFGHHCIVGIGYTLDECYALIDHYNIENFEICNEEDLGFEKGEF